MLKKLRIVFIAFLLACVTASVCVFAACDGDEESGKTDPPDSGTQTVAVESVTLNKSSLTLETGEEETLTATVFPDNATNKAVTWTSSAEAVATVTNGKVKAVAGGTAVITAAADGKSATCTVTVSKRFVSAESISLNKSELTLEIGSGETLNVIFNPENATDKSVEWNTVKRNIATVDRNGRVTAIAEGTTTVTADAGNLRATCLVTVIPVAVKAESVTLNKSGLSLEIGDEEALTATVLPADAADKTVTWSSSAPDIASVDANGKVCAVAAGNAVITVKTANNKKATCTVAVNPPAIAVESITLNKTALTLKVGVEENLSAEVLPANAADKTVTWSSSAPDIASVDANGKVTAAAKGSATITAKTSNDKSATCTVTVIPAYTEGLEFILRPKTQTAMPDYYAVAIGEATDTDIVIPEEYEGLPVLTVAENGFKDSAITSIIIPDSITGLPRSAFVNCKSLTSITLPDGLKTIADRAFSGSGLTAITLPDGLEYLGAYVFEDTAIESITVPGGINSKDGSDTGLRSFAGSKHLKSVIFEEGIKEIRAEAFKDCEELESITIPSSVIKIWFAFEGCAKLKKINISDIAAWCKIWFVTDDSGQFYANCSNPLSSADLYLNGKLVTELTVKLNVSDYEFVASRAFYGYSRLTGVNVQSANYIGEYAFAGCENLTSVTIGTVYSISEGAFKDCPGITEMTFHSDIGKEAFKNCTSLKTLIFESSTVSIGQDAFAGCPIENASFSSSMITKMPVRQQLKTVTITSGHLDTDMFKDYTGLTKVTICDGVTLTAQVVFPGCTFTEAVCPADMLRVMPATLKKVTVTSGTINNYPSFYEKLVNLTDFTIGSGVTSVADGALDVLPIDTAACPVGYIKNLPATKIKKLTLTDGEAIPARAFTKFTALESITFHAGLKTVGSSAFNMSGTKLQEVHINNLSAWCKISFDSYDANPLNKAKKLYLNGEQITDLVIPNDVTEIGSYVFYNGSFTSIRIPANVTSIKANAFFRGVKNLYIESVAAWCTTVSNSAYTGTMLDFSGGSLYLNGELVENLVIPAEITSIPKNTFAHAKNIKSVTIENGVTGIGDSAFTGCYDIKTVTIPVSVKSIDSSAFQNATYLTDINYGGSKAQWNSVTKGELWNMNTGVTYGEDERTLTIHCSDGDIVLHPAIS